MILGQELNILNIQNLGLVTLNKAVESLQCHVGLCMVSLKRYGPHSCTLRKKATIHQITTMLANSHLDLSRCPLLHQSLQTPVRVVIQPESAGWPILKMSYFQVITTCQPPVLMT